jgi:hypothetical protein
VVGIAPTVTFDPGFVTDVSGKTLSIKPGVFEGSIFMGNVTFSGILLNTVPGYTYDFQISYIPSFTKSNNIENFNVSLISNVKNTALLQESGIIFETPVSNSPVKTLIVSGQ